MKNPDIFVLIKSLSPSEKRYFKLFASQQTKENGNAAIKLYDLLEKWAEYNEEKVLNKLKPFGDQKQISVIKVYLYNLILKSLRNYYAETSTDLILNNFLQEAEILFERGMIEQCEKLLDKSLKIALGYEKFSLLIEIYNRKERVLYLKREINPQQIYELRKNKQIISDKTAYHSRLVSLGLEVFSVYKTKSANRDHSNTDISTFEQQYIELIREGENNPEKKSIFSQNHIHYIQFLIFWLKNDIPKAFNAQKQQLEFIESNFSVFEDRLGNYIGALNNYMDISYKLNQFDLFLETLHKLKTIPDKLNKKLTEQQKARVFKTTVFAEYNWHLHNANFTEASDFSKSVIETLPLYSNLIGDDANQRIHFWIAYIFYGNQQLKESLFWLNKFVNELDAGIRPDLHTFSRILRLIIFYENNQIELLEHAIRSFEKHIGKKDKLQYEFQIIGLLKKLTSISSHSDEKHILETFRSIFMELKNNKTEARAFSYFDIIDWIDSKLHKKTFAQVKKERSTL